MLKVFSLGNLDYDDKTISRNVNNRFWKRAWHTKGIKRRADEARRENVLKRKRKRKKNKKAKLRFTLIYRC